MENLIKGPSIVLLIAFVITLVPPVNATADGSETRGADKVKKILTDIQQSVSADNSKLKTELDKAKNTGKVVFVVVTGIGVTDIDKAMFIAINASEIYKNSTILQINKDDGENAQLVNKWHLAGVQLPLILVISPRGLMTGCKTLADATTENIVALVPSPSLESLYSAVGSGKSAIVVFSKKSFPERNKVIKITRQAVSMLNNKAVFIEVDITDTNETNFLKQFQIDRSTAKNSITLVINKRGQVAGTVTAIPDAENLVSAANKAIKGECGPGCCPASCEN